MQLGLCLVGLRDVLGSSFLDLQSQVFSNSMTLTSLHMSRLLGKCAKDSSHFSSSFHPLGLHAVALCPVWALQSQVHPILVSTLRSAVPLFRRFVLLVPLGSNFLVDLVPWQFGSCFAFSQFPSASSLLSPCSLGCEAPVSSKLCWVEFFSCFQHREIHLTHPCVVKGLSV